MSMRGVFFMILAVLTVFAGFDLSRGGLQKIGTQISQAVILPAPLGGTNTLDDNWFENSSP